VGVVAGEMLDDGHGPRKSGLRFPFMPLRSTTVQRRSRGALFTGPDRPHSSGMPPLIATLVFLLALAWTLVPGPGLADQEDPRLGPLFERLQSTGDAAEAQAVEMQ